MPGLGEKNLGTGKSQRLIGSQINNKRIKKKNI
jgi:hypothetical protein